MFKVLVIDDENIVRRGIVMSTNWSEIDCMVIAEAANGEEGLAAIEKYHPDIVICDIRMPKMDGITMLQTLREMGDDTFVIFLTAYSDFTYAQQAVRLGANDYLLKPFEDGELEKAVQKVTAVISKKQEAAGSEHESDVLSHASLQKGDKSKYVAEAIGYIADHFADADVSVGVVAEAVGVSESHLSHIFKKETDYTVSAFVTRFRMREAMRLLKTHTYKIYEVAELVGYRDIAYFSSTFKKLVGVNPSEYQDRV